MAAIVEPEGAVFQGERIAGLIVGPAAFAAAEGVAGAVNNRVVPRAKWAATQLEEQMKITVIRAVCGG